MGNQAFGPRLRELRKQAGLSQRELAEKIGVSFTYLSKIESGVMPPPSEKVLGKLAEALNIDEDELLTLAGKIPADILQILRDRETLQALRKQTRQKTVADSKRKGISPATIMKKLVNYRGVARVATAIVLVVAMASSMWLISPVPVKALDISFPSLPGTGTLGTTYSFQVKVSVEDTDLLPVDHINLEIYNSASPTSYKATVNNLPIPGTGSTTEGQSYTGAETGGGAVSVTVTSAYGWTWASGSRYGYGYREPGGMGTHTLGSGFGYGYAYDSNVGPTSVTYSVTWTSPASWPQGSYKVKTLVYGDSTNKWSGTSSTFSLSTEDTGGDSVVSIAPGVTRVAGIVNSNGVFVTNVDVKSADNKLTLKIKMNTKGKTKGNAPIWTITIKRVAQPPSLPANAQHVGDTYDAGPDGATFDPPISLTLSYDPADLPEGFDETNLLIAVWDTTTTPPQWVMLGGTVDAENNTITVLISHFSQYTIIASTEATTPVVEEPVTEKPTVEKPVVEEPVVEEPVVEEPVVEEPMVEEPVVEEQPVVEPEPAGLQWWIWLLFGLGAVVIVAVITLVIRRRNL